MNLSKSLEYFDPINDVDAPIHVIGVGAMGSRIVELLVRLGITKIHIWDMDTVEDKNITNQLYFTTQIGMKKTEALADIIHMINPTCEVKIHDKYTDQSLAGYVFLCVDSIELRYNIAKMHENNPKLKGMFDTRMRLEDAQSYAADWTNEKQKKTFISSMEFTDDEAKDATPVSACGTTLSVASTVVSTAAFTISNFMNLIRTGKCKTMIFTDAFKHTVITL
ncbi:MAG: ThiF family adenylyltransferase [Bacilli bacterium]|nr:ThiF family adenylyltransferase [Bacilli bacterium]